MTRHNLTQRVEALERGQDADDGTYVVCIGNDDCQACRAEQMTPDELHRLYPERLIIDIGGPVGGDSW